MVIYGDLVDKFKRIVEKPNFSDQFKIIKIYKKWDTTWDVMQQSVCLILT